LTQPIERGDFFSMKKTPTRKIDLDLENSIFSHDQRLRGEISGNLRKPRKLFGIAVAMQYRRAEQI
jgi:hypothetical protein